MLAQLFANRIMNGRTQFDSVPRLLKPDVAKVLIDMGYPTLVPVEFGGTMEPATPTDTVDAIQE